MAGRSAELSVFLCLLIGAVYLSIPIEARAEADDDPLLTLVFVDELEYRGADNGSLLAWNAQGWLGKDLRKLWIKTEGQRSGGSTEDVELQFLYSRSVGRYWDFQTGVRQDFEPSPSRTWVAIGFQGLSPYFFEIDTALFIGESGRTALRLEAGYDLLFTQRLILTPDIEVNLYGKDDPDIGVGSCLSNLEAGLRLRYEFRREFAPYIGLNWSKLFGGTADFAVEAGESASDLQLTIGLRAWF